MSRSWYAFIGGEDPIDYSRYIKVTVKPHCLCGDKVCAIYASGEGVNPTSPLSENMQTYIKAALLNGSLQPEKPSNAKKYVYLKY